MALEIALLSADEWQVLRDLRIRAATQSSNEIGETLEELLARTSDEYWKTQTRDYCDHPDSKAIFILWADGKPEGLVYAEVERREVFTAASIAAMWLDPKIRSLGWGKRLLSTALDWARKRGAMRVTLFVVEGNERAMKLYEGTGFSKIGHTPAALPGQTGPRYWRLEAASHEVFY